MNLEFTNKNNAWEAEFTASADFNLHVEGLPEGDVRVFQSSVEGAGYAEVRGAMVYPSFGTVYDFDFSAVLYPKYIKVVCKSQPTLAVVTIAE